MLNLTTAVQAALSPAITLPVIAALSITVVTQAYIDARRMKNRLREQSVRLGKMTAALLATATVVFKRESERQVIQAIEFTYEALKDIGFDKLASGNVAFEGVMFGDPLAKAALSRHRHDHDSDQSGAISMDELLSALCCKPRYSDVKTSPEPHSFETFADTMPGGGEGTGTKATGDEGVAMRDHENAVSREGDGGQKGPRPYSKAPDFGSYSPRAG
jgi:hypothetical protein